MLLSSGMVRSSYMILSLGLAHSVNLVLSPALVKVERGGQYCMTPQRKRPFGPAATALPHY